MKVTIEKVSNGYLITTESGEVFIANAMNGYSGHTVTEVLREIFTPPKAEGEAT